MTLVELYKKFDLISSETTGEGIRGKTTGYAIPLLFVEKCIMERRGLTKRNTRLFKRLKGGDNDKMNANDLVDIEAIFADLSRKCLEISIEARNERAKMKS